MVQKGNIMPLPDITHLQFLVLQILLGRERSGREVRERLAEEGARKSLAAFYQMMARLEDAKMVEGSYRAIEINGQKFQERWYKIIGAGRRAWDQTRNFYFEQVPAAARKGPAHA
jgi:hypothetical protein